VGFQKREARVPLDERNEATAFGSAASAAMNLDEADLAPEGALNEIVWKSVRGVDSPMPPPKRAAFVRNSRAADDDDDDKEAKEEREDHERKDQRRRER
jgi:hypothetical protein